MRKFAIGKAAPDDGEPKSSAKDGSKGVWFREHWRLLSLFAIIIAAFLMRFVFAYGISAGDNYALSGGSSASNNLRIVEEILAGTYSPVKDAAMNYPFGSANAFGPLFDYIIAAIAYVVTLFGVSDATAAAGVLAWSAPVLGALTCIPVYMAAKRMFRGDETVGVAAALFYAFFALLIMTTPFSNGTGFAFVCFVAAWAVYFLASAFETVDREGLTGPKGVFGSRQARKYTLLAGVFFAAVVLSWTDFRMYAVVAAVCLSIALIILRIGGKDVWSPVLITDAVLAVGLVFGAAYYIPAGLWDSVFSGGFVLGILTIVFSLAFAAAGKKPWVVTIPVFLVAIAAVAVAFAFGLPEISNAMTHGNSIYSGSLMQSLAERVSRTSISGMASYYGWLTLWFPLVYGAWMVYRRRHHSGSRLYGFTALFLLSMFFVGWFSVDYAAVAGSAFAIGCAILSVRVVRAVNLKGYFASLRGNGFKAGARRALKFFPFTTVVVAALLVVLPNAIYAVDAATPTNDEKSGYYGGLGYSISTTEDSMLDTLWNEYSDESKSGALVTWLGNSNDAVIKGGFKTVTDAVGGGSSVMAAVYLSDSSAEAVAALALRIMLSEDIGDFEAVVTDAGLDYDRIVGLTSGSGAREYVSENPGSFTGIDAGNLTDENAVYLAVTDYIVNTISEDKIQTLYSGVCAAAGHYNGIKYVEVDGSMLPLYYNDSSSFPTMAYLGNYTIGSYGEASEFYTINTSSGYASYTSSMYQTFLWKALFGIDGGSYSSTVALINELALADKDVRISPAATLDGFTVVYWHVMYNPDSDATSSSDGWVEMDAYEAIAKQKTDGGLVNYLSSVVLLEYTGNGSTHTDLSGTVTSSTDGVPGVKVAVFEYDDQLGRYVQRSTAYTDSDGVYTVSVPASSEYYVTFSTGATTAYGGTGVKTVTGSDFATASNRDLVLTPVDVKGTTVLATDGGEYAFNGYVRYVGVSTGRTYQADVNGGVIDAISMVPDVYDATLYLADGTSVTTVQVVATSNVDHMRISVSSGTLTVKVTDSYGAAVSGKTVTVYNTSTGETYADNTGTDGSVKIVAPAGTYAVQGVDGYAVGSVTATLRSGGTATMTVTAYEARSLTIDNTTGIAPKISAIGYSGLAVSATKAYVPAPGGVSNVYTAYVIADGKIYYGSGSGDLTLSAGTDVRTVSGTVTGSTVSGVNIAFVKSDGAVFCYTSGSDGKYVAYLPDGDYTVYAYKEKADSKSQTTGEAVLKSLTVSADITSDSGDGDLTLGTAYSVKQDVRFDNLSSTSKVLFFYGLSGKITSGGSDYSVYVLTDTSGNAVFWVPEGGDITVTLAAMDTSTLKATGDQTHESSNVTANKSLSSWSFAISDTADLQVKKLSITNSTGYELNIKEKESAETYNTVAAGASLDLYIGKYYIDVDTLAAAGYHADKTFTLYLGQTELTLESLSNGFECHSVEVKYNEGDTLSITALENSDGETGTYVKGTVTTEDSVKTVTYYLQNGFEYIFDVESDGKVAISQKISADGTVDLTSPYETVKVSGYVGVTAVGDMTVTYTYNSANYEISVNIKEGEYEFSVPKNVTVSMTVSVSVESSNIRYTLKTAAAETVEVAESDVTHNFSVVNNDVSSVYGDVVTEVTGTLGTDGTVSLTVNIENVNDYDVTYIITGSPALVLDQAYTLSLVAGASGSVTVTGHFDATTIGAGSTDMYLTVSDTIGTEVATYVVPADLYAKASVDNGTSVDVTSADKASPDSSSGSVYRYAVTIRNSNPYMEKATVAASFVDSSVTDWKIFFTDSTGYIIYADGTEPFKLNGFSVTTLYIMLINTDGESSEVPKISVSVTVTDVGDSPVSLSTSSEEIAVTGNVAAASELEAQSASLSTDSASASNGGASAEGKKISMTFWALFVLTILVLLLIIWIGSKRGVFARK